MVGGEVTTAHEQAIEAGAQALRGVSIILVSRQTIARVVVDAVTPMIRAEIAAEIEANPTRCCLRGCECIDASMDAARIARDGGQHEVA
jgi:hypothetical protein